MELVNNDDGAGGGGHCDDLGSVEYGDGEEAPLGKRTCVYIIYQNH